MARPMRKLCVAAVIVPQPTVSSSASLSACADCLIQLRRRSRPAQELLRAHTHRQIHGIPSRPKAARSRRKDSQRRLATVQNDGGLYTPGRHSTGPLAEYDARVSRGKLTNDEHQRNLIQSLQDLHNMLEDYHPPNVDKPSVEDLKPVKKTFLSSIFGSKRSDLSRPRIPEDLPKGLYMFGDVGSGKTMLMDLFYDTLPPNITSKTRIHFHNFMQDVHKRLHKFRMEHGNSIDGIPFVAADIAAGASVLCFDEFQCTDVADAMILRRLMESLMAHGSVIVTTSNRQPTDLYKNGIQRQSFIPCINLLQTQLRVINLDSQTDYRKRPRPSSGVYHHPLDKGAQSHADKWFAFLGSPETDPPHPAKQMVWGREVEVPLASGTCARFSFQELIGRATGAADYIEMMRSYDAFVVTEVPGMTYRERDWARRFITFIDAVYESRAKLVLTTAVPLTQLFLSRQEAEDAMKEGKKDVDKHDSAGDEEMHQKKKVVAEEHGDVDDTMRMLMDDLGMSMTAFRDSSIFSGDEEMFAFARALSRLSEMGSQEWVERGMGLDHKGGKSEQESWKRVRSKWREDAM